MRVMLKDGRQAGVWRIDPTRWVALIARDVTPDNAYEMAWERIKTTWKYFSIKKVRRTREKADDDLRAWVDAHPELVERIEP
jgi:hypothetical protein